MKAPLETRGPEAWARRVRGFGVEAATDSDTYRVALVLVASLEIGQNIDRLARRTGSSRPLVAKCARRLVDNGVWLDGQTVAQWVNDRTAGAAFERDVAVGLGHLLRRIGPGGRMEWAEAGRWNKSYERDDDESSSTTYVDAAPRRSDPVPLAEDLEPVPGSRPRTSKPPVAPALAVPSSEDAAPKETESAPAEAESPVKPVEGGNGNTPSLEQVFSDAVWLR